MQAESQPLSYPGISSMSVQFLVHRHSFQKPKHHNAHLLEKPPQRSEQSENLLYLNFQRSGLSETGLPLMCWQM